MSERRRARHQAVDPIPLTDSSDEEISINLEELLYQLLNHWKMIICLALVGAVLAGLYSHFVATPMYRATSTIYVLSRKDSAINMADLQIGAALTQDYIKVFSMWEVHEEVISMLDLPYSYSEIQSMLSVTNDNDTRMLDITITSPSAQEAAAIANAYASVSSRFIEETMSTDRPNTVSVARVPANPISPNKTRNTILGFLLAGFLTAGAIILQTLLDDKYKTADDIRRYTGLSTLAVIPTDKPEATGKKAGRKP